MKANARPSRDGRSARSRRGSIARVRRARFGLDRAGVRFARSTCDRDRGLRGASTARDPIAAPERELTPAETGDGQSVRRDWHAWVHGGKIIIVSQHPPEKAREGRSHRVRRSLKSAILRRPRRRRLDVVVPNVRAAPPPAVVRRRRDSRSRAPFLRVVARVTASRAPPSARRRAYPTAPSSPRSRPRTTPSSPAPAAAPSAPGSARVSPPRTARAAFSADRSSRIVTRARESPRCTDSTAGRPPACRSCARTPARLYRHDDLEHRAARGVPRLALRAGPRPQEREADFAVLVEIRVEPHAAAAGGSELHQRRGGRVRRREERVEEKRAAVVRRVLGPGDEDRPLHRAAFVHAHERGGGSRQRQRAREAGELARHAGDVRAVLQVRARFRVVRVRAAGDGRGVEDVRAERVAVARLRGGVR
eukprot:30276-Pelagococcus_subviridis.AAC.2